MRSRKSRWQKWGILFVHHLEITLGAMFGKGESMGVEPNYIRLRGLVVGEYKFGISHEGYEDLVLVIDKDFESEPSVFLKPIPVDRAKE